VTVPIEPWIASMMGDVFTSAMVFGAAAIAAVLQDGL